MTHPSPKRNMVPKAVLMRSGLVSLTTTRPVNTAQPKTTVNSARPMTNVFNKAHSTVRRPINNKTATKNSNFNKRVNTVSGKNVNTARPKAVVNAARPKAVLNAVKGNQVNDVKASACWVWKPKTKVLDHGNPQMDLQDQGVIDSGCSWHMTGNMSYLTDFEEIDGGYVAFGGNPKGGKITGRDHLGKFDGKVDEGVFVGYSINSKAFRSSPDAGFKPSVDNQKKVTKEPGKESGDSNNDQEKEDDNVNNTNNVNTTSDGNNTNNVNAVSPTVNYAGIEVNAVGAKTSIELPVDPNMLELEDIVLLDDDKGCLVHRLDINNFEYISAFSPI
ncbi:hypothetical protein Tco_0598374 [Tanacetum coccineum]